MSSYIQSENILRTVCPSKDLQCVMTWFNYLNKNTNSTLHHLSLSIQQINHNEEHACASASLATWRWYMDAAAAGQNALSLGVDRV